MHRKLSTKLKTASASNSTLAVNSRFRDARSFTSKHLYILKTRGGNPMEDIYLFIYSCIHSFINYLATLLLAVNTAANNRMINE